MNHKSVQSYDTLINSYSYDTLINSYSYDTLINSYSYDTLIHSYSSQRGTPSQQFSTGIRESRKKHEKKKEREVKKRRRGGGREGYKRYVFRVLKQVHPEVGISGQAMVILNNLMNDMFERLAEEATKLSKYTGKP